MQGEWGGFLVTGIFYFSMLALNTIFSSAVFVENTRYWSTLGVIAWCKKLHFVISLLLLKIFTGNSKYVFTIQRAIHTIKGDNFFFFFFKSCPFFDLDFLSSIKHSTDKHWHPHAVLFFLSDPSSTCPSASINVDVSIGIGFW